MKKIFRKTVCCVLCLATALALGACSGKEASSDKPESGNDGEAAARVSQEFLDSLNGMSITIAYPDKMRNPGQSPIDDEWQMTVNRVSKELGVTIKEEFFTNKENGASFITESLSGNNSGNIEVVWFTNALLGAQKNAWADLDAAAKEAGITLDTDWVFAPTTKACNIDNVQYGVQYKTQFVDFAAMYYNVNMVTVDNKLEDPYELYLKNEWTFDKFEEYCKKLTKTDASGNITVYGCQLPATAWVTNFIDANGGSVGRLDGDGRWKQTLSDSKTLNAYNYVYKWMYSDKCVYVPQGTWDTAYQNLWDGKTAMVMGASSAATDSYLKQKDEGGMGVVPLPKGPDAEDYSLNSSGGFAYVIPVAYQKDAAKYLYVIDEISRSWYENFESVYSAQHSAVFKDQKYYDFFYKLMNNDLLTDISGAALSLVSDSSGYSSSMLTVEITNGASPATAISRFASAMQNENDDVMGDTRYTGFN